MTRYIERHYILQLLKINTSNPNPKLISIYIYVYKGGREVWILCNTAMGIVSKDDIPFSLNIETVETCCKYD